MGCPCLLLENDMSRRKLARRFEPRYGVSQSILDRECKWVEQEFDEFLVRSVNELKERLAEVREKVRTTEARLETGLSALPSRERLALKCMLIRDVFHIAKLYESFLRSSPFVQNASGAVNRGPPEVDLHGRVKPALVFQQSLFERIPGPEVPGSFSFRRGAGTAGAFCPHKPAAAT
jgi:hypothetical protein